MKETFVLCFFYLLLPNFHAQKLVELTQAPKSLTEISAAERVGSSNKIWVIEDAGNSRKLYSLDFYDGNYVNKIEINNAVNKDWEDLTSDKDGNIYIGDFGNNNEEREVFCIYKIHHSNLNKAEVKAKKIEFKLPENIDSKDFEGFFLNNNRFYIVSKEKKKPVIISVPNEIGSHKAKFEYKLDFKGKDLEITSADASPNGKIIAFLNHDQLLVAKNYNSNNFNELNFIEIEFNHDSQKEGLCFVSNTEIIITDERDKSKGGKIYKLTIK